jgi:hypothetical protein
VRRRLAVRFGDDVWNVRQLRHLPRRRKLLQPLVHHLRAATRATKCSAQRRTSAGGRGRFDLPGAKMKHAPHVPVRSS